jgi:MFS family permease
VPVRESNASANGARRRFVRFEHQIFTRPASSTTTGLYHGWLVVAAAFVIALLGFGVGFYGPGIYLVALEQRHGWSAAEIASAITLYYVVSAVLVFFAGGIFERFGARRVVAAGAVAMAGGVVLLTVADRPWQVYAAFAAMSPGWAAMSGAAINIIVAPWFDRRRGFAVSLALNGASAGGIVIAPLLLLLIGRLGFARAMCSAAALMLAVLLPVAGIVLRPKRPDEHENSDRSPVPVQPRRPVAESSPEEVPWRLSAILRSGRFQTISSAFALGMVAQVGFLTHQVAYLSPLIGAVASGWAVSLTTFAAVVGRVATGFFIDRVDRRAAACANFLVQATAMGLLASANSPPMLYLGCALFGLAVGNMITLPALIVQQEFPKQHFARIVSLIVAINQFTFAFGPALLGFLRQLGGSYTTGLVACLGMETMAALIIVWPLLQMARSG